MVVLGPTTAARGSRSTRAVDSSPSKDLRAPPRRCGGPRRVSGSGPWIPPPRRPCAPPQRRGGACRISGMGCGTASRRRAQQERGGRCGLWTTGPLLIVAPLSAFVSLLWRRGRVWGAGLPQSSEGGFACAHRRRRGAGRCAGHL